MSGMRRSLALALCGSLAIGAAPRTQTVRTIISNGPTTSRYDVVILGDGYTSGEQTRFDADCLRFSQDLFLKEPYRAFAGYFNIHTVFRASQESGADHPDASPPIYRNTAYDASYNTGGTPRCLYIGNTSLALADAALAPATEGRILVMVNDSRYGGCASTFAVSYTGSQMSEVQIHEMGHSIGGLADEYDYPNSTYTGGEPGEPNATISSAGQKWSIWQGTGGISAFEGCRYYRRGIFRPRSDCQMRSLGRIHCAVCTEALVLATYRRATPIGNPVPATSSVTLLRPATQVFGFTNSAPASSATTITWRLDGQTVQSGSTSYTLASTNVATGPHLLEVEVQDNTNLVRRDPGGLLRPKQVWNVLIQDPTVPDLTIELLRANPIWLQVGASLSIDTTVKNNGGANAPATRVDHFLSTDPIIDASDIFLGSYTTAGLGSNQSAANRRTSVQLPLAITPGAYYVGAFVDRDNLIPEGNEGNNTGYALLVLSSSGCTTRLEFRDALLYPKDSHNHSLSGLTGAALPTVASPCDPGSAYIILWGCAGTNPGTPLGNGLLLPLNLDACSGFSIGLQNTTAFANFFGHLGPYGIGQATFDLRGLPYQADLPGHFAAAILDPQSTRFTRVSNPVSIRVVR